MNQFSQKTIEAIQHYVYLLKDPRCDEIFYIGEGCGNRIFQHVSDALEKPEKSDKLDRIREIKADGYAVKHYILRHKMEKSIAHVVEAVLLDLLANKPSLKCDLTNKQSGWHSDDHGMMANEEIEARYEANPLKPEHPLILINVNKRYHEVKTEAGQDEKKLYEITRGSWRIGVNRSKAEYALATYKGLVRAVYLIESWEPVGGRWRFIGTQAPPEICEKYRMTTYKGFVEQGATNPIRYLGF